MRTISNASPSRQSYWKSDAPADFMSSIVVFLVALPLCMGIAVASGVPPSLGIITGIVGGIVVGALAGSPLQVSGPAAGLTVLVWQIVQDLGIEKLGPVVLLAGILQMIAWALKSAQMFRAVSPAVIRGMLGGIGVLIIGSQTHIMVDDAPKGSGWANWLSIPEAIYKGILPIEGTSHHYAAYVGLLTIIVMIFWKYMPRRLKVIPAPLAAVVVAAIAANAFRLPIKYVSVSADLMSLVRFPDPDLFFAFANPAVLTAAVAVALIASAETLLCATAVDQMHQGLRTNYDKELLAQGVGNAVCGLLGALPMTGVIVRSTANIEAGGKTRGAAIFHGFWLLALVLLFPGILSTIPTTSLAAVLVYTGFKLVSPQTVRLLRKYGRSEVAIYLATIAAIVATDLLKGVIFGVVLAAFKLLYIVSHMDVRLEKQGENRLQLEIHGAATFVRLPQLAKELESIPANTELHVSLEHLTFIDHACIDLLSNWEKQHASAGGKVIMEWESLHELYFEKSLSRKTKRNGMRERVGT
ncbi:MAG: SulP family inorganic anion transporter [Acidobacteriota bacterium]